MLHAGAYSAVETLRNGCRLEIRAYRPSDKEAPESAVGRTSALSLYRRFFTIKRDFTEREWEFLLNVDFITVRLPHARATRAIRIAARVLRRQKPLRRSLWAARNAKADLPGS